MAETSFELSLQSQTYHHGDCLAAIRGLKIPASLGWEVQRLCVVRGIRHHPGFGEELRGVLPIFTRALNARKIMSNEIPEMMLPEDLPYCIWYPSTATEATYRTLVGKYPQMKYQVARACAVANYPRLYDELDVLPEVHVAAEARDNGSTSIFNSIMSSPIRYEVMNDYTLTINLTCPRPGAHLNGDTATCSWLLYSKQKLVGPQQSLFMEDVRTEQHKQLYYNITEDMSIDEQDSPLKPHSKDEISLMYSPLPADLPVIEKDHLILMAAYYGDVDRYCRLRRPKMIRHELACIVRGIYHNTMFAKWWSIQTIPQDFDSAFLHYPHIKAATNARFIMNNDLSHIDENTKDVPYLIWYPGLADAETYRALAGRRPDMKEQIARACIAADYKDLFDELGAQPTSYLVREAQDSRNPYYLAQLQAKIKQVGHIESDGYGDAFAWKNFTYKDMVERSSTYLLRHVAGHNFGEDFDWIYNGHSADIGDVELFVSVTDEFKAKVLHDGVQRVDLQNMYRQGGQA